MSRVSLGASCRAAFACWVCCGGPPCLGAAEAAVLLPGDLLPYPSLGLSSVTEKSLNDEDPCFPKTMAMPSCTSGCFCECLCSPSLHKSIGSHPKPMGRGESM